MKMSNDSRMRVYQRQLKTVDATQQMYGMFLVQGDLSPAMIHYYTDRYRELEESKATLLVKVRELAIKCINKEDA